MHFNEAFISCHGMCAPTVTRAVKRKPVTWRSDNIREAMEDRNGLQRKFKGDTNNLLLRERYKINKNHGKQ